VGKSDLVRGRVSFGASHQGISASYFYNMTSLGFEQRLKSILIGRQVL